MRFNILVIMCLKLDMNESEFTSEEYRNIPLEQEITPQTSTEASDDFMESNFSTLMNKFGELNIAAAAIIACIEEWQGQEISASIHSDPKQFLIAGAAAKGIYWGLQTRPAKWIGAKMLPATYGEPKKKDNRT